MRLEGKKKWANILKGKKVRFRHFLFDEILWHRDSCHSIIVTKRLSDKTISKTLAVVPEMRQLDNCLKKYSDFQLETVQFNLFHFIHSCQKKLVWAWISSKEAFISA